jgi:hypothetical protein
LYVRGSELLYFKLATENNHCQTASQVIYKFLFSDQRFKHHILSYTLETGIDSLEQNHSSLFMADSLSRKFRPYRNRSITVVRKRHLSGLSKSQSTGLHEYQLEAYQ